MGGRWKAPASVADILKHALKKWDLGPALAKAQVMEDWPKIVGAPLAAVARPMRFQGEILWIEVDHPAWIQELNLLKSQLLRRLDSEFPGAKIRQLRFSLKR